MISEETQIQDKQKFDVFIYLYQCLVFLSSLLFRLGFELLKNERVVLLTQ